MNRRSILRTLSAGCALIVANRVTSVWARAERIKPDSTSALIVVDVQNCFVAGGTLAVKNGETVVPVINAIAPAFQNVILTQDWHTAKHAVKPITIVDLQVPRTVWLRVRGSHDVPSTPRAAHPQDGYPIATDSRWSSINILFNSLLTEESIPDC
jgi:Isochorismatase family